MPFISLKPKGHLSLCVEGLVMTGKSVTNHSPNKLFQSLNLYGRLSVPRKIHVQLRGARATAAAACCGSTLWRERRAVRNRKMVPETHCCWVWLVLQQQRVIQAHHHVILSVHIWHFGFKTRCLFSTRSREPICFAMLTQSTAAEPLTH